MSVTGQGSGPSAAVREYSYAPHSDPSGPAEWNLPRLDAQGRQIGAAAANGNASGTTDFLVPEEFARRLAEETRRSFEAGRQRGLQEGRDAERASQAPAQQHRADQLRRLLEELAAERDRYLRAVEHEVVRLALAIAARILRRESQMDPLLLLGAVRVSLGQLAAASEVRLHVPAADAELWKEAIALLPNPPIRPVVVPAADLRLGECRLETTLGSVDLGLRAQLSEIERGFFDRAPAASEVLAAEPVA